MLVTVSLMVHTALVLFRCHCPEVMDWSPVSPEMSLIENVWIVVELILHKAYNWMNLKEFKTAAKQAGT